MKLKQRKLFFVIPNTTSSPNRETAGRNSVNNLSAPYPDQETNGSDGPQEPASELIQRPKKKGFFETYGCLLIWFILLMCITAVVIPCVLLLTMYVSSSLVFPYGDCVLLEEYRTPCVTGNSVVDKRECEKANCCWDTGATRCFHSIPARHSYLWSSSGKSTKIVEDTDFSLSARLPHTTLLTSSYPRLRALLRFVSQHHLRIIIATPESSLLANVMSSNTNSSDLEVYMASPAFAFDVYRKEDDSRVSLISSSRSPLIASDNYWEIGLRCPPDGAAFGLGGLVPENTTLLYSSSSRSASFPYLMCLGPDGKAHGLMIRNMGPVEVSFSDKSKLVMLRASSNSGWDINILSGPTPGDVVTQLTEIVGRPTLPPYWALGFHVCRDFSSDEANFIDVNTTVVMDEVLTFLNSSMSQGLPYDTDCIHERLLSRLNVTASVEVLSRVATALNSLKANGKKFLLSLSPQVVEEDGDIFILEANGSRYEGEYRDRKVFYPDFTHPNTTSWMASRLQTLTTTAGNLTGVLAGFVLTDNWPEDVSLHDTEELPYIPQAVNGTLSDDTVYWSALHWNKKRHYEIHNNYGRQHAELLRSVTDMENPVIISSSCTLGSPACLNQQQVSPNATWDSLKEAVISVLGSGLAGVSLAGGGPVCGAQGDAQEDVCLRWFELASVLPIARVSSSSPLKAANLLVLKGALTALKLRYSLLPYMYTLLSDAAVSGAPLLRPMFYEFPQDPATWDLHHQFMVGPALLAAPGLEPDISVVDVYLPVGNTTWYLLDGGLAVNDGSGNITVPISSNEEQLILLLRGGHVLPMQEPGVDTQSSRLGSYKLVIALDYQTEGSYDCSATGHMTLEENVTVTFYADSNSVTIGNLHEACSSVYLPPLTEITVLKPTIQSQDQSTTYQTTLKIHASTVSPNATETSISTVGNTTGSSVDTSDSFSTGNSSNETNEATTVSSIPSSATTVSAAITSSATVGSSPGTSTASNQTTKVESNKRKKRQIFSTAKSSNSTTAAFTDTTQPLTYKLNSTSLCNGENTIMVNYA